MNSKQTKTIEGTLLVLLFLVFAIWFIIRAWQPAVILSAQTVPVVKVESLESAALSELAGIAESGKSYGIPVEKPAADQVGKSPLF